MRPRMVRMLGVKTPLKVPSRPGPVSLKLKALPPIGSSCEPRGFEHELKGRVRNTVI